MRCAVPVILLLGLVLPRAGAGEPRDGGRFFEEKIRPIFEEHCFKCHSHSAEKIKGGLVLDSRDGALTGGETGPALVSGEPAKSLLIEAVEQTSHDLIMPPKKSGGKLSAAQIEVLTEWVRMGAPYPPETRPRMVTRARGPITDRDRAWWAFQPLAKAPPPAVAADGWSVNDIDRFIFQKLTTAGLQPAARATPAQLIRRITYDITGLPPTPEEVEAFVRECVEEGEREGRRDGEKAGERPISQSLPLTFPPSPKPSAYARLVDRLLASPRYGEHAARAWLDLVRYAESDGFKIDDYRPHAWRYRDYVIAAFNADKPYDRFVCEQLAGDELFPGDVEALAATGFLRHGIYEYNSRDVAGQWTNILNDITDVSADVFLGLSLQCARCHDHKFDPILQKDYYRWQAFFAPILIPEEVRVVTPELRAEHAAKLSAWEEKTTDLRRQIAAIEDPANEKAAREAIKKFPPETQTILNKLADERTPWETQIADLAFRQVTYEWQHLANYQSGSARDQLAALRKQLAAFDQDRPPELPVIPSVSDVGPVAPPTFIPKKRTLGEIAPGFPSVLAPEPARIEPTAPDSTGRRAALARWLTQPGNPLTARLIVNRVWQQHFGRGLAASANDFGHLGQTPSHPELLDWLATRFLADGWSLKKLHRLILLSATYQQAATPAPETAALARTKDPENLLLAHARTRRLSAEQIRDSILAITGELDLRPGGPSVETAAPRRTIFTKVLRNTRDPLLEVFDAPESFGSVPSREVTTTSTQALQMLNSATSLKYSATFARRLLRLAGADEKEFVAQGYRLALGRAPTTAERDAALAFLARQAAAVEKPRDEKKPVPFTSEKMPFRDGRAAVFTPGTPLDRLHIPDQPNLATGDFTIEGFIVLKSIYETGDLRAIAAQWSGEHRPGWVVGVTGRESRSKPQTLALLLADEPRAASSGGGPAPESVQRLFSGLHLEIGKPYFVAVAVKMRDATAPNVTFYTKDLSNDDQPLQSATLPLRPTTGLAGPASLLLAAMAADSRHLFHGQLDDVRLSNVALPADQLLLSNPAVSDSTVGYWKFERDPGVYRDSSPRHADIAPTLVAPTVIDPQTAALTDFCHVLLNANEFLYVD
ncbi:MAG: DUF1553 domain-containing protein [Chthoniobacter sp.]|nr:DUF1553 domain-containing protein [Chthoniobacter sp.]